MLTLNVDLTQCTTNVSFMFGSQVTDKETFHEPIENNYKNKPC